MGFLSFAQPQCDRQIGGSADRRLWVTGVLFGNSMSLLGEGGLGMDLGFENDDPEESEGDQHWLERSWV